MSALRMMRCVPLCRRSATRIREAEDWLRRERRERETAELHGLFNLEEGGIDLVAVEEFVEGGPVARR